MNNNNNLTINFIKATPSIMKQSTYYVVRKYVNITYNAQYVARRKAIRRLFLIATRRQSTNFTSFVNLNVRHQSQL